MKRTTTDPHPRRTRIETRTPCARDVMTMPNPASRTNHDAHPCLASGGPR